MGRTSSQPEQGGHDRWAPLRIALAYVGVGLLWIGASDHVASVLAGSVAQTTLFQTLKGSFYVVATGLLLWWMIARHSRRLNNALVIATRSEARYRALLQDAPVAILLLRDGRIEYANAHALMLLGGADRIVGSLFSSHIKPDSFVAVEAALQTAGAGDEPTFLADVGWLDGLRTDLTVEMSLSRTPADHAQTQVALTDVTELRNLETIARHAQKMDAVGSLAAHITHEFNNILTAILGHTAVARSTPSAPPDVTKALTRIEHVGRHAAGLTRSMLSLTRSSPALKRPEPLDLIIAEAADLVRGVLPHSIEFVVRREDFEGLVCRADASQIKQTLLNLSLNARDAMMRGGKLTISGGPDTSPDGRAGAVIHVTDTGPGIPPLVKARLFTPFFTTKPAGKGTGLGLAISRSIVLDHAGTLTADSVPGQGATFSIWLPTCAQDVPALADDTPTPHSRPGKTILVGEDNAAVRDVVAQVLRSAGYSVHQVADGRSVLTALETMGERVDALLLDVGLPNASGVECLVLARIKRPGLPCLLTSGGTRPDLPEDIVEHTGFLAKPFAMDDLLDAVQRLFQNHAHRPTPPAGSAK